MEENKKSTKICWLSFPYTAIICLSWELKLPVCHCPFFFFNCEESPYGDPSRYFLKQKDFSIPEIGVLTVLLATADTVLNTTWEGMMTARKIKETSI